MAKSKIEWTDRTDNIIVVQGEDGKQNGWYCQKVSPGCKNCYAESFNQNPYYNGNQLKYAARPEGPPPLMLKRGILEGWARRRKPKKVFVNSMTDTFGEFVPDEWVFEILTAMANAPKQTFQVLTKRAKRMYQLVWRWVAANNLKQLPANIWLGVSVENQAVAEQRIHWLSATPAQTRFLSCEPLLGPVVLGLHLIPPEKAIHWVIVGGESGPNARPMHPDWVRSILAECKSTVTPFFFKQWGAWLPYEEDAQQPFWRTQDGRLLDAHGFMPDFSDPDDSKNWLEGAMVLHSDVGGPNESQMSVIDTHAIFERVGKKKSGRLLDGREWNEFPERFLYATQRKGAVIYER